MSGAMYLPDASGQVIDALRGRWDVVQKNPLGTLVPEATKPVYIQPLVTMLHEELGKLAAPILSPEFQAIVTRVEEEWRTSPAVSQQLKKHLQLALKECCPTKEHRIAVIHAFLYWFFLEKKGISAPRLLGLR